jgi:predicted dehydrogenase
MSTPRPNSGGKKVLLVGCGQLGSRHLQALASLAAISVIEVLDPSAQSLELGKQRVWELHGDQTNAKIRWITALENASTDGDLCIISTQAKGRCRLLRLIADELGYSSFILEKIADQSISEIEESIENGRDRGISTWVNCQTRTVPTYQRIKDNLNGDTPIYFNAVGGMQFLATNGIHTADLFAYYDECAAIEDGGMKIDPVLHPSKRGRELYDLTGTLHGYTSNGSSLTISYGDGESGWGHFSIASRNYRCVIDHTQEWMMEAGPGSDWKWRQVPFDGSMLVSETTKSIAQDILESGVCGLPTLEESLVSHRFILNGLLPHFSALMGRPLESCPVS